VTDRATKRDESWRHRRDVYHLPAAERRPDAVYIHVPFCLHRCGYCDFTLVADRDELVDSYLIAIAGELRLMAETCDVSTIYIGGGTPTHLTAGQLQRLLTDILHVFRLKDGGEFTVEANPDGLTNDRLRVLTESGVNRLSLGVQSFDASVLKTLERSHTAEDVRDVIDRARQYLSNVSVDLIFGVPGQTHDVWEATLATATQLSIQHISTYGLTFEKGTDYYRKQIKGELLATPSEDERRQYATAMEILNDAGFAQYEISNHAQPNHESIHNNVYWNADEYFAFGPGAARYVNGIRSTNSRHVERWITSWLRGVPLLQEIEELSVDEKAREAVMLGLRRNRGMNMAAFRQRFGISIEELAPAAFALHLRGGLLEVTPDKPVHLRFTNEGRFLADTVMADFL